MPVTFPSFLGDFAKIFVLGSRYAIITTAVPVQAATQADSATSYGLLFEVPTLKAFTLTLKGFFVLIFIVLLS